MVLKCRWVCACVKIEDDILQLATLTYVRWLHILVSRQATVIWELVSPGFRCNVLWRYLGILLLLYVVVMLSRWTRVVCVVNFQIGRVERYRRAVSAWMQVTDDHNCASGWHLVCCLSLIHLWKEHSLSLNSLSGNISWVCWQPLTLQRLKHSLKSHFRIRFGSILPGLFQWFLLSFFIVRLGWLVEGLALTKFWTARNGTELVIRIEVASNSSWWCFVFMKLDAYSGHHSGTVWCHRFTEKVLPPEWTVMCVREG